MPRTMAISLAGSMLAAGTVAGSFLAAGAVVSGDAAVAATSACASCGHNLIQNPGAEAAKGSIEDTKVAVPDWTPSGNFTAATYHWAESDINASTPGPKKHGKNYFYGGPEGRRHATGTQVIALARSGIKNGHVTYKLSGWLGGYSSQRDNATLTATFETVKGRSLAVATIGPVTPGQRKDDSGLLHRATTGTVPKHAAQVVIVLDMTRHDASDNDGLADNLSLVLTK